MPSKWCSASQITSAPSSSASAASCRVSSMTTPSRAGSRLSGNRNVPNFTMPSRRLSIRGQAAGSSYFNGGAEVLRLVKRRARRGRGECAERLIHVVRCVEIDARMAERHPMEALAEQPAGMRPRAVIMAGQGPARLAGRTDMGKVAALGAVAIERAAFQRRFVCGCFDRDLAAALVGEAVRADPPAGEIVGGE